MKIKNLLLSALILSFLSGTSYGYTPCSDCPTDNPMETFYGDSGDYAFWTEEISWTNVIDMSTYSNGTTEFEKFKNARDELYDLGTGGVLYYPAGSYNFDIPDDPNGEGLMLKKGIVIRGEHPGSDKIAVTVRSKNAAATDHGLKSMPTKLIFSTTHTPGDSTIPGEIPKAWNCIGSKAGTNEAGLHEVSHIGIAWCEIQYGFIHFGMENKTGWADTWATSKSWIGSKAVNGWGERQPDGTHPMDAYCGTSLGFGKDTSLHGEKFFVFGCILKNAAISNYMANKSGTPHFEVDVESWRFGGKISIEGEHVFVANNVIAKPTACFRMDWYCKDDNKYVNYRFDYGYGIGIDVNKSLASAFVNRCFIDNEIHGTYYLKNVIIQDNVVYNHGNKSIEAAGKFLVIKGNVIPRDFLSLNDDPYGIGAPGVGVNTSNGKCHGAETADDMMCRTMDLAGWNMWIHNNYGKYTGCDFANDGEGILFQRNNGVEVYSLAETHNTLLNGYIAPYDVHAIGIFQAWNVCSWKVGVVKTESNWVEDASVPESQNWDNSGTPMTPAGPGGTNVQDFYAACNNVISADDSVINFSLTLNEVERKTTIDYTDNSANEMAFRIEKRKAGTSNPWTVIAYRPRQETTTTQDLNAIRRSFGYPGDSSLCFPHTVTIDEMNKSLWVDYKTNIGEAFEYRVCAIDCNNNTNGCCGGIVGKEIVTKPIIAPDFTIKPNPASSDVIIEYTLNKGENATITVLDIQGKVIDVPAQNTKSNSVIIQDGSLNKGVYLIKLSKNTGGATVKKLIIK